MGIDHAYSYKSGSTKYNQTLCIGKDKKYLEIHGKISMDWLTQSTVYCDVMRWPAIKLSSILGYYR